jgi:hypothetical protein
MRNNKKAGNRSELRYIHILKKLGYDAASARLMSRDADNRGVDIVGDFPFDIQVKNSCNQPNFYKLLNEKDCNVVFWEKTEKSKKDRFVRKADIVVLYLDDFLKLIGEKK